MKIWPNEVCDRLVAQQEIRIGYSITQSVMAKNKISSKLIHHNQKQRSNKEPQKAIEMTFETP